MAKHPPAEKCPLDMPRSIPRYRQTQVITLRIRRGVLCYSYKLPSVNRLPNAGYRTNQPVAYAV